MDPIDAAVEGVPEAFETGNVDAKYFHRLALRHLESRADGKVLRDAIGPAELRDRIDVKRVDSEERHDDSVVDIGRNGSIDPDGAAEIVKGQFRVRLGDERKEKMVELVQLPGQFGMRRKRIGERPLGGNVHALGRFLCAAVEILQIFRKIVNVAGFVERTRPSGVYPHVDRVPGIVAEFGELLEVSQSAHLV